MLMNRPFIYTIGLLTILLDLSACQQTEAIPDNQAIRTWQHTLDSLGEELAALDDKVAQTTLLRNYAGALLDVGYVPESLNQRYRNLIIADTNVVYWHNLFLTDAVPTHCDVISKFYLYLLSDFGFKATNYTYGLKNTPFTHTITAIEIGSADRPYIILQDATLATLYLDQNGEAIHLSDLWHELLNGRPQNIRWVTDTVTTNALVLPEAVEPVSNYLSTTKGCDKTLAELQERHIENEILKTTFRRHYYSWKDHCDRFDQKFLAILAEDGYTVDQKTALLVEIEIWGGAPQLARNLQKSIREKDTRWDLN